MSQPTGAYAWLNAEPGPRMLGEALKLYGTLETPGAADNPVIIAWADEVQAAVPTPYNKWASAWYENDATAWCGLFAAVCAVRSNPDNRPERRPPDKYLSALSWKAWGEGVPIKEARLGDALVFERQGGGHVGLYAGEDATAFHVLGGNTADSVSIARLAKTRCVAARRPPYLNMPANVRKVWLAPNGAFSRNEA